MTNLPVGDDGRIELDNNRVGTIDPWHQAQSQECAVCRSDRDAEHRTVVASLLETCKLNDVDLLAYLTDVLTRIVNGIPTATSTVYRTRPAALKPSKPRLENFAYNPSMGIRRWTSALGSRIREQRKRLWRRNRL